MKIKRYVAASMRAALTLVRTEQGADAVILSSRRTEEGIEVIAAVDYDEALFADAAFKRAQPAAIETAPLPLAEPPEPIAFEWVKLTDMLEPMFPPVAKRSRPPIPEHDGGHLCEPLQARVLEQLTAMDIAPDVARALAALTPRHTSLKNPSNMPLALLVSHLPVVDKLDPVNSGVIALVGPTGAGKTTTIAKLAARWSMQHGSRDLALVSTDAYRIGAREQLMTYARLLGAPMHAVNGGGELAAVLERLKDKKLVLIDTAGMAPRDVRLTEQLAALRLGASRARVLLALPAQGEGHALEDIVQAFARVAPAACVLTKVDEAASLGAAISISLRHKLPIAYLCNGQRVPEDLHSACGQRVWLVRKALKLKERTCRPGSDATRARRSEGVHAHA